MKIVFGCLLLLFGGTLMADSVKDFSFKKLLKLNSKSIVQVQIGMSENAVRNSMPNVTSDVRDGFLNNPWREERMQNTVILHYLVRKHPPFTPILENQADPIILVEDKVVAIGRSYLATARADAQLHNNGSNVDSDEASLEDRLIELQDFYEAGLIDESKYKSQKKRALDSI